MPCSELACRPVFFFGLPRLPPLGSLTCSHLSESCDSHGHVPDSSLRTPRLGPWSERKRPPRRGGATRAHGRYPLEGAVSFPSSSKDARLSPSSNVFISHV
ncbi:hypothetical protein CRG98_047641 [Punica granatum]|uniref:Uncharacterized protein n=1 Tax=Punica granatum TaxID=22663 RepID=A0A2I0HJU8_PUNGR|nr:hypothetical protein CRG98_047641 [Punica granatum]